MQKVYIIDDDETVLEYLKSALGAAGLTAETFTSAMDFLDEFKQEMKGCIVLDVIMSSLSGLMLQQRLNEKGCQLPIIFVSGYADVAMAAKAFKAGAFDFLQKPFNLSDLLDRIHLALEKDANQPEVARDANEARMKLESLTRREREVLDCLIKGCTSKEIAKQLDISHRTVDVHRQHILTKFNTNSVPALLAMLLETS